MLRLAIGVFGLTATLAFGFSTGISATAAQPPSAVTCQPTRENPIAICFADEPLTVDHCSQALDPHFAIRIWHEPASPEVAYRYSYRLIRNGNDGHEEEFVSEANPAGFPFRGENPVKPGQRIHVDADQSSLYAPAPLKLHVTVTTQNWKVSKTSPETTPPDQPRIRTFVIGVGTYANTSYNLHHAEQDATLFSDTLHGYLGEKALIKPTLFTSKDRTWKKDDIESELFKLKDETDGNKPWLCTSKDWFIFYFSGHGVVGFDPAGHYLTMQDFDPKNLLGTAIKISELIGDLKKTRAKNYLVILDSCVSGYLQSRTGASSGKLKYVNKDGDLVAPFKLDNDGDALALKTFETELSNSGVAGVLLSASSSDAAAEEGYASYEKTDEGEVLKFVRTAKETEDQKLHGHGLFTFAFISNLLAQLPKGTSISSLLPTAHLPAGPADCRLNFKTAAEVAVGEISRQRDAQNLQAPEPFFARPAIAPIGCTTTPRTVAP